MLAAPNMSVARPARAASLMPMSEFELRDRFLGGIAGEPGTDPEGPAVVDFGDLVRKLILFDEIVVESHNLKEFAPLAQKFGYHGVKALLESGRLRFVREMPVVVDIGQAPMPYRRTSLPNGSYSIHAVWARPPREFLSRQLHKVDAVTGLTSKQAQKVRQLRLPRSPWNLGDGGPVVIVTQ